MTDYHGHRNRRALNTRTLAVAGVTTAALIAGTAWLAMAKSPPKKVEPVPTPAAAPQAPPAPGAPAASAATAPSPVSAKLSENGAGACAAQLEALAAGTMGGVSQFNTVSKWATGTPDKRLVGVLIGQKYAAAGAVPYGAATVMAAPNAQGSCDALAIQVLPSPLPCAKLRDTMAAQGRQIGELADSALMQDPAGETLLVPTSTNTCVMVALRSAFAK